MYEEWLNSIPFIKPNCYYNNIEETFIIGVLNEIEEEIKNL